MLIFKFIISITLFLSVNTHGMDKCEHRLKSILNGANFLHLQNKKLHMSNNVILNSLGLKYLNFTSSNYPSHKIASWLDLLESTHFKKPSINSVHIKKYYLDKFVKTGDCDLNE